MSSLPNPFANFNSADAVMPSADTAVAFDQPQAPDAAAIQSSTATGGCQEAAATAAPNTAVAALLADDNRFDQHFDETAFMIEIAERPFFLQAAQ